MNDYIQAIRDRMGTQLVFIPGVRALILNSAGEILLHLRTDIPYWGLPSGSVELDETALEALKREVQEETALEVLGAEPMALYSGQEQRFQYPNGDRIQCFAIAFIVRQWQGHPRADGVEGSEVRFFPLESLPENLVPLHQATIEDFRRYDGSFLVS